MAQVQYTHETTGKIHIPLVNLNEAGDLRERVITLPFVNSDSSIATPYGTQAAADIDAWFRSGTGIPSGFNLDQIQGFFQPTSWLDSDDSAADESGTQVMDTYVFDANREVTFEFYTVEKKIYNKTS